MKIEDDETNEKIRMILWFCVANPRFIYRFIRGAQAILKGN